jgi:hypothetical protein
MRSKFTAEAIKHNIPALDYWKSGDAIKLFNPLPGQPVQEILHQHNNILLDFVNHPEQHIAEMFEGYAEWSLEPNTRSRILMMYTMFGRFHQPDPFLSSANPSSRLCSSLPAVHPPLSTSSSSSSYATDICTMGPLVTHTHLRLIHEIEDLP